MLARNIDPGKVRDLTLPFAAVAEGQSLQPIQFGVAECSVPYIIVRKTLILPINPI